MQPYGQVSEDGVAVGQCIAHDVDGPFGYVTTAAVANDMAQANSRRSAGGAPETALPATDHAPS
jgi:hypothetical protein